LSCPEYFWGGQWVRRSNYARTFDEWFSLTPEKQGELIALLSSDLKHDLEQRKKIEALEAERNKEGR